MDKVSIVIPIYNSDKYLYKCINSICQQTYRNIEVLCVDDGSTDESCSVLNEFAIYDHRISVFKKENEGKGAASARNMGLSYAKGKYVIFLDSDDFFHCELIRKMVWKAKDTNADVVICDADRYDDALGTITGDYRSIHLEMAPDMDFFSWKDCPHTLFQIGDTVTWNKLYRRDFLQTHQLYFEEIPISDDQYVPALALALANRIAVTKEKLVHYRFHTGTSQTDSYAKHPDSAYMASFSIINRLKTAGLYAQLKRSYLNTAVRLLRDYYDKIDKYHILYEQHKKYLGYVLPRFDAENLPPGYFYDDKLDAWYQMITHQSLGEILFSVCSTSSHLRVTAEL